MKESCAASDSLIHCSLTFFFSLMVLSALSLLSNPASNSPSWLLGVYPRSRIFFTSRITRSLSSLLEVLEYIVRSGVAPIINTPITMSKKKQRFRLADQPIFISLLSHYHHAKTAKQTSKSSFG